MRKLKHIRVTCPGHFPRAGPRWNQGPSDVRTHALLSLYLSRDLDLGSWGSALES